MICLWRSEGREGLSLYLLRFQLWEGLGRRNRSKLLEKRDRIRIHRAEQFRVGGWSSSTPPSQLPESTLRFS